MSLPGRKAEYDSLAFAVIAVIFISLIFWIVSMSTDIALVVSPQTVNSCLGGFERVRLAAVTQAQKSMKQMQKMKATSGLKTSRKNIDLHNSSDIASVDPNAFSSAINPMIAISKSATSGASTVPKTETIDASLLEGVSDDVKAYLNKLNAEAVELRAALESIRSPALKADEIPVKERVTSNARGSRNQRAAFEPTGSDSTSTTTTTPLSVLSKLPLPPPSGPPPKLPPPPPSAILPPPPPEVKEIKIAKSKTTPSATRFSTPELST
jgi:hypothetical protein